MVYACSPGGVGVVVVGVHDVVTDEAEVVGWEAGVGEEFVDVGMRVSEGGSQVDDVRDRVARVCVAVGRGEVAMGGIAWNVAKVMRLELFSFFGGVGDVYAAVDGEHGSGRVRRISGALHAAESKAGVVPCDFVEAMAGLSVEFVDGSGGECQAEIAFVP